MYFQCDITNITALQLAEVTAIETLFKEQSQKLIVKSINPLVLDIKTSMVKSMRERLLRDRVPYVLQGYTAEIVGNELHIKREENQGNSPENSTAEKAEQVDESKAPAKSSRKRSVSANKDGMAEAVA